MYLHGMQAVVLDAVGTLIHPEPAPALVYAEVGQRFGSRLTPQEIGPRFAAAFARQEALDLSNGLATSEDRELQRWRQIVAEVLADAVDPEACFRELYNHFSRPAAWRCEPETARVLDGLADRGLVLALASNFDYRLRGIAAGLPALQRTSQLLISSEVGWRKPAPQFFAAVCRSLDLPARRILFVGDDRVNDQEGALAAGMRAVLFDPRRRETAQAPRVTHLEELLRLEGERPA